MQLQKAEEQIQADVVKEEGAKIPRPGWGRTAPRPSLALFGSLLIWTHENKVQ